ncbi:MAG: hypothetical protein QOF19_2280 [Alphaproteobacteria bacterium]|nr:hypothetical protein [Alphaproteobacteria bacterium]
MRSVLLIVGILCLLLGLVWIGQGTGYFPYPASSFMIRQMTWAYYGIGLAVIGLIVIAISRKM